MFGLDLHTFLILVEFLLVIYTVTAFFVYAIRRHTMHLAMGFSFLISLLSFTVMHQYLNTPDIVLVIVYNALFILSSVLIIGGFRAYYKLRLFPWRYLVYLVVSVYFVYFFTIIFPSYYGRVGAISFFMVFYLSDALFEAEPFIRTEQPKIRRVVYTVFGSMMIFFILRFVLILFLSNPNSTLLTNMETTAITSGFFSIFTFNFWLVGSMLIQTERIIKGLNAKSKKMEDLAMLDPLTKMYNRNKLEIDLQEVVDLSNRQGDVVSILLMDIDHFKQINDTLGHDAGDEVLLAAFQLIRGLLREDDKVYRWGGDEFLVLTPHTDINGAARLAQRILDKLAVTPIPQVSHISVSIGCAQHFQYESKINWFKRVDLALYKAKQSGRNRFEVWSNKDVLPTSIAKLVWIDSFESGHAEIDRQHKNLVRLSNELYDRLGSADSLADMEDILDRVQNDLTEHFTYESSEMFSSEYPDALSHKNIHDHLLAEYAQIRKQLKQGTVNLGVFFNFVSVRIVAEHIIKEDTKFFEYLKSSQR